MTVEGQPNARGEQHEQGQPDAPGEVRGPCSQVCSKAHQKKGISADDSLSMPQLTRENSAQEFEIAQGHGDRDEEFIWLRHEDRGIEVHEEEKYGSDTHQLYQYAFSPSWNRKYDTNVVDSCIESSRPANTVLVEIPENLRVPDLKKISIGDLVVANVACTILNIMRSWKVRHGAQGTVVGASWQVTHGAENPYSNMKYLVSFSSNNGERACAWFRYDRIHKHIRHVEDTMVNAQWRYGSSLSGGSQNANAIYDNKEFVTTLTVVGLNMDNPNYIAVRISRTPRVEGRSGNHSYTRICDEEDRLIAGKNLTNVNILEESLYYTTNPHLYLNGVVDKQQSFLIER